MMFLFFGMRVLSTASNAFASQYACFSFSMACCTIQSGAHFNPNSDTDLSSMTELICRSTCCFDDCSFEFSSADTTLVLPISFLALVGHMTMRDFCFACLFQVTRTYYSIHDFIPIEHHSMVVF